MDVVNRLALGQGEGEQNRCINNEQAGSYDSYSGQILFHGIQGREIPQRTALSMEN
jgi:hypothetical protein